jgi:hypothetical protein
MKLLQTLRHVDLAPPQLPSNVAICECGIIALESVRAGLSLEIAFLFIRPRLLSGFPVRGDSAGYSTWTAILYSD